MKNRKMKSLLSLAIMLCVMVTLFSFGAYADYTTANVECTVNQDIGSITISSYTPTIESCSYTGSIPPGLQLSYLDTEVYLYGTPTEAGEYEAQISMETVNGPIIFNLNVKVMEPSNTPNPIEPAEPDYSKAPSITKNPTGETVEPGGTAQFVARADNAESFVWRIVSADTTNTIPAKDAAYYFSGLEVSSTDSECLTLENIPKSLNGWAIECKFTNSAGASFTTGAIVTVTGASGTTNDPKDSNKNNNTDNSKQLQAPKINTQPKGAQLSAGQSHTLTVYASNASGIGQLTYQWYSSDTNDMNSIKAIDGANSSSYTPPETDGAKYYCVGVWLSKDGQKSTTTYSPLVEVKYGAENANGSEQGDNGLAPLEPSPSAAPTVAPTPVPTPEDGGDSYDRDGSSALVFYIVIAALALLAVGGILVYLAIVNSRRGRDDE